MAGIEAVAMENDSWVRGFLPETRHCIDDLERHTSLRLGASFQQHWERTKGTIQRSFEAIYMHLVGMNGVDTMVLIFTCPTVAFAAK